MSSVVIYGDTSGAITLTANAVAGTNTITLPAQTGTMTVGGPTFSAYSNVSQNITTSSITKLAFQVKEWDTASCYDNTTNYRFTPTVAGYYQVNAQSTWNGGSSGQTILFLYKNGTRFKDGPWIPITSSGVGPSLSALVYCNGSTDYLEIWVWQSSGGTLGTSLTAPADVYFQAAMVRGA